MKIKREKSEHGEVVIYLHEFEAASLLSELIDSAPVVANLIEELERWYQEEEED